jgi:hypothetical protein
MKGTAMPSNEDRFVILDDETDERFGPFARLPTRDHALARNLETGHGLSIHAVRADGSLENELAAVCFEGMFLVPEPHDAEGNRLPCRDWLDGPAVEPEDN